MRRRDAQALLAIVAGVSLSLGALIATGQGDHSDASSRGKPASAERAAPRSADPARQRSTSVPDSDHRPDAGAGHQHKAKPRPKPPRSDQYGVGPIIGGRPTGIRIHRLGVDTTVAPIDAVDGSLVPPSDYTTVGWWAGGPAPGSEDGTAIITGHTVRAGGGAFDELSALRPGDRVVVERHRHRRDLEYVVARVRSYEKGALARHAARVFSPASQGRLALVTCGDWNGERYLSNVVVIATDPRPLAR
jgi:hypothetical protein